MSGNGVLTSQGHAGVKPVYQLFQGLFWDIREARTDAPRRMDFQAK